MKNHRTFFIKKLLIKTEDEKRQMEKELLF
jgi:hypothetical protein